MEFYIDTADLDAIKKVVEYYPVDGFTTNPKILTKAEQPIEKLMPEYKAFVEKEDLKIFFQVTAQKAEDMLKQAKQLKKYFGMRLVIKIPAVKEGYKAIRLCKKEGISVCMTVVHSMTQALIAAKAGADYVAPYVTHIDNIGAVGTNAIADMVTVFKNGGYECKVLGASFRTVEQVKQLAVVGCQAVTITPEMFECMITHACTNEAMVGFEKAWKDKFGDRQLTDFI